MIAGCEPFAAAAEDPCAGAEPTVAAAKETLEAGRWADALGLLAPLEATHADCAGVALALARLRASAGQLEDAERLFERATTLAPGESLPHALFAQYWLSRGQQARADYHSSLALSLDPECSEALLVAARLLTLKGREREAYEALEKAARVGPDNAEAQYQFGAWVFRRKLHEVAARQFEKAVALRPTDARALDHLALAYEALGDAERAEQAYQRALKVNEGRFFDPFVHHNYGRFLLKQQRLDESRSQLDRAMALLPDSRAVHYERGKLNLALEQYQAARQDAERALVLRDPSGLVLDLQVYYLLATVYTRLGETDLARKYAELARTTPIPNQ